MESEHETVVRDDERLASLTAREVLVSIPAAVLRADLLRFGAVLEEQQVVASLLGGAQGVELNRDGRRTREIDSFRGVFVVWVGMSGLEVLHLSDARHIRQ